MNILKIHISPSYKSIINNLNLNYDLINNEKIDIKYYEDYKEKENLDLNIRHVSNYSSIYIEILYKNKIFINNFRDKYTITRLYKYSNNLELFPYTFICKYYNRYYIEQNIKYYKKLYNNNKINKCFGIEYWLVKSLNTYNFTDILLLTEEELLNYKSVNIFIQKYLERPLIINKKKHNIKIHIMIFPKIIKKNNKYKIKIKENIIKYNIFLHKYYMGRYTINDYKYDDNNIYNFNTLQIYQGFDSNNIYNLKDDNINKLILESLKKLKKEENFEKIVNESIYGYPYFGQIIAIEYEIDENKKSIYIDRITDNMGLDYDEIYKSKILDAYYQKLIKLIYKIRYNKLIKYKKKYTKDLIKI